MLKKEILKKLEILDDDSEVNFLVFDIDGKYKFHRLELSAQWRNDPPDVIAFVINRYTPSLETAREASGLQKAVTWLLGELKRITKE